MGLWCSSPMRRAKVRRMRKLLTSLLEYAEERLASRRQARAEAKEIRMRELEKQREADGQADHIDSQYDNHLTVEPPRPPRGIRNDNRGVRSTSFVSSGGSRNSSRRNSEDYVENIGSKEYKLLMNEVTELEEKFCKAMVNNAQLDNEKTTFSYEVDTLKDELEEQEELYLLSQKNLKTISRDYDFLKRDFKDLQQENSVLKEKINQMQELISENDLVLVGGEEESEESEDSEDEDNDNENQSKVENKRICRLSEMALVSQEAADILLKAGSGTLDMRLKRLDEEKQELIDQIYRLRLDYEEEKQKALKMEQLSLDSVGISGQDLKLIEAQREANKQISNYKYKLKNSELVITALQSSLSRVEAQLSRYKTDADTAEGTVNELKAEKRKLQRELRDCQARIEELDTEKAHLQKRIDKLKTIKNMPDKT